ncbi:MAG: helix-turn-helix domain-containing protein [Miltoncostaeaceae bacterium]
MPKKSTTSRKWLTVRQTARRLGETEEAVRRMIRAGDLPAQKATSSARAPWVVDALALEDQIAEDEQLAKRRARMAGVVVGYGEDFHRQVAEAHPDTTVDGSTKLS